MDLLGALPMPRCTSLPRQQPRPLQISRGESAWASWQNSIETNCVQQPKPLAPFGAVFSDQRRELAPGKMLERLIEQTGRLYHWIAILLSIQCRIGPTQTNRFCSRSIIGGLFLWSVPPSLQLKRCLGQE